MIGQLTGKIAGIFSDHLIVDVGGVGYIVFCSGSLLTGAALGQDITVIVETAVRDDAITLYGFSNLAEKALFLQLTTIQGVGARTALGVLAALGLEDALLFISRGEEGAFRQISGIGPKTAMRIVNELRGNKTIKQLISERMNEHGKDGGVHHATSHQLSSLAHGICEDAISALVNLGFARARVADTVKEVVQEMQAQSTEGAEVGDIKGDLTSVLRISLSRLNNIA